MKLKNLVFLLPLFFLNTSACADVNSDLNKFFNDMNYSGINYNKGEVWKGQAAGYLVGGGLYARTGVKNIQLVSMSIPSVNAGCGGIDLYLGSFSYINSEQITRFVKSVMSNSVGYAFDLALTTLAPTLKQVKDYLEQLAQDVNQTNFSSCQAAQAMVGSIGVVMGASKDYVCNSFGNMNHNFSDWVQSRMECGTGKKANSMVNKSKANASYKDLATMVDTNLTWYILKEKSGATFGNDRQLKEFVMTIVGTIVFKENNVKTVLPSLGKKDVVKALLNGGETEIYACDEETKCLNPTRRVIYIDPQNSALNQRVLRHLQNIIHKIEMDSPALSKDEENFIESTSIPILKYMIDPMSIATTNILLGDITKHISYDILYQYLSETITAFSIAAANTDIAETTKNDLQKLIMHSNEQLREIRAELNFQENQMLKLEQQMRYIRTQASSNLLANYMSNYEF
ncbi:conjugal transfer protein TraH [Gilliamella sp. BG7]|uniref:conjugal transfer protein TraH n=1 Tax=unclassified Gilliamella TaxID=2685620 RepID=UPI0039870040